MDIVVDSRVRIPILALPPNVRTRLEEEFDHVNPAFAKAQKMGLPTWKIPRRITTWKLEGEHLTVPRGGVGRVRDVLRTEGLPWKMIDLRFTSALPVGIPDHKVELRDYQRAAITALIKRESGVLRAATGCGKTTCLFGLAAELKRPTLVIVHSGALFDHVWMARARSELGYEPGQIRGAKRMLRPLTIAMQQTLAQRGVDEELKQYFEVVLCDEVHKFAATTFLAAVDPFPARYRIGVSDDERRADRKEFLIHDLFGPVAYEVGREGLVDEGHILDVEVRVVPTEFEAPWHAENRGARAEQLAQGGGLRRGETPTSGEDFDRLLREMAADEGRQAIIARLVEAELRAGEQVVLLAHRIEHARRLDALAASLGYRSGLMLGGEENRALFSETLARLASGQYRAAAGTYQALGTGIDMPSIAVAVAATPIAGNKQFVRQVMGRVCRTAKGKGSARLYYPLDVRVFGLEPLRQLARTCRTVVVWDEGWVPVREYLRRAA